MITNPSDSRVIASASLRLSPASSLVVTYMLRTYRPTLVGVGEWGALDASRPGSE